MKTDKSVFISFLSFRHTYVNFLYRTVRSLIKSIYKKNNHVKLSLKLYPVVRTVRYVWYFVPIYLPLLFCGKDELRSQKANFTVLLYCTVPYSNKLIKTKDTKVRTYVRRKYDMIWQTFHRELRRGKVIISTQSLATSSRHSDLIKTVDTKIIWVIDFKSLFFKKHHYTTNPNPSDLIRLRT